MVIFGSVQVLDGSGKFIHAYRDSEARVTGLRRDTVGPETASYAVRLSTCSSVDSEFGGKTKVRKSKNALQESDLLQSSTCHACFSVPDMPHYPSNT